MHGNARIVSFLAQRNLRQQRDALTIGDEFHDGREGRGREGAGGMLGVQAAGGDGLVTKAMPFIQQQYALWCQ